MTAGPTGDALEVGPTTIQPRMNELEAAGLVIADPPMSVNDEAATELYLRLGVAIGEF